MRAKLRTHLHLSDDQLLGIRERIEVILDTNQLLPSDFARKMEVSVDQLSQVRRGRREPTLPFLVRLATTFNVDMNWLVFGKARTTGWRPRR